MTTEDVSEEDLGKHLDQVLRSALGNNVEDLNIGKILPIQYQRQSLFIDQVPQLACALNGK